MIDLNLKPHFVRFYKKTENIVLIKPKTIFSVLLCVFILDSWPFHRKISHISRIQVTPLPPPSLLPTLFWDQTWKVVRFFTLEHEVYKILKLLTNNSSQGLSFFVQMRLKSPLWVLTRSPIILFRGDLLTSEQRCIQWVKGYHSSVHMITRDP